MMTDMLALVVGIVFGILASIPTSLLVAAATRKPRVIDADWHPVDDQSDESATRAVISVQSVSEIR